MTGFKKGWLRCARNEIYFIAGQCSSLFSHKQSSSNIRSDLLLLIADFWSCEMCTNLYRGWETAKGQ